MRFSVNATAVAALLWAINGLSTHAFADSLSMPSEDQLKSIMKEQGASRDLTLGRKIDPVKAGTFKAIVPDVKAPAPAKTETLDEVLARYSASKEAPKSKPGQSDFIIFVSFSMPKDVLKELARQAKEMGGVMVVRGFQNGSMMQTKQAALDVNKAGAMWEIHPELFKAFKVESVPTFVVASAEAQSVLDDGCSPEATYTSVSGNISAYQALDTIRIRAQPEIAKMAELKMARLKEQNAPGRIQ